MITELFTPYKIGTCTIPNRLVGPAMVMNLCTEDGMITERYIRYREEKAKAAAVWCPKISAYLSPKELIRIHVK